MDTKSWNDFVNNHPNGNMFQSVEFYQVYKNSKLCEPLIVTVLKNGEIYGLLLANIKKEFDNVLGHFSSRAIVLGGPLVKNNDSEIMEIIISRFDKYVRNDVIYTQYRNLFKFDDQKDIFLQHGYKYTDHLNIQVDLTKCENELWLDVNSKAKNRIRGAIRKGTIFKVEDSIETLEKCHIILEEVYKRIGLPLPDIDYFINLYNILKQEKLKLIIFTAQNGENIIGCLLAVGFQDTLFGLYNGACKQYYDKLPNDLLPWEIFKWAKNNGYKKFDWLGAGKPTEHYGVRDYKLKFGERLLI